MRNIAIGQRSKAKEVPLSEWDVPAIFIYMAIQWHTLEVYVRIPRARSMNKRSVNKA